MRKKIFFVQVLFIALFSCQLNAQTTDLVKYLPESATMIMDIDGASLSQKLSWKELMAMSMFDSLLKKAAPGTRKMIAEPSETGINFRDHLFLVIDFNETDEENTGSHIAFYGKVQDEAKLSALLNKAAIKEIIKKTSGENKMFIGKDFVFGWNKSVFVLHSGTALMKQGMPVKISHTKKELARLEKRCIELLTPKVKNIYSTNKHFANLMAEKADMRIWTETAKMNSLGKGKNPFAMFGMSSQYQGKYKTAIVNFENGKIISKGYTYYSDDIMPSIQKMYAEKLNTELIKKLPSGNLMGLFAMSFDPDAINDVLEKTGIWEEFKKIDGQAEFDPRIILDNLKGDILFSVSMPDQPEEISEEDAEKNPFAGMQIYMAATVKDEKRVKQLIDSLKLVFEAKKKERDSMALVIEKDPGVRDSTWVVIEEKKEIDTLMEMPPPVIGLEDSLVRDEEVMIEDEEVYTKNSSWFKDLKPVHKVENGVFVFSLSDKHLEKFGASTGNVDVKIINEYGNYPMLMTIDLKTIFSIVLGAMQKQRHYDDDPEMYTFFETFDKWIIAGGKFENGAMQTMQEIKFSSPDENSLKQIMNMIDLVFQAFTRTKSNIEIKDN